MMDWRRTYLMNFDLRKDDGDPYTKKWIEPRHRSFHNPVTSKHVSGFELYDFTSSSWKVLDDVTPEWVIRDHRDSVSLKGNTYFRTIVRGFIDCFYFTTESFGPLLPLPPFQPGHREFSVSLSCVREDQLALLYQQSDKTSRLVLRTRLVLMLCPGQSF
ncbi:unnamed protein product [Brassica rapa subsp. trilocularis]